MKPARTIFVIDDDGAVLDALSYALAASGYDVVKFASAAAFLDRWRDVPGAVLVSDIRLPRMDGIALTRHMHATGMAVPIILLTGHADELLRTEAIHAGAAAVFEKPCELLPLIAEIERVAGSID